MPWGRVRRADRECRASPADNLALGSDVSQYGMVYFGYIWLTSGNVTQTIRVTMNVMPPAGTGEVNAQPDELNFAYTIGSPLPGAGDLVITHSQFMPVTISYAISSPAGGTTHPRWLLHPERRQCDRADGTRYAGRSQGGSQQAFTARQ